MLGNCVDYVINNDCLTSYQTTNVVCIQKRPRPFTSHWSRLNFYINIFKKLVDLKIVEIDW